MLAAAIALYWVPGLPAVVAGPGRGILSTVLVALLLLGGPVPAENALEPVHFAVGALGIVLLSAVGCWVLRAAVADVARPAVRLGTAAALVVLGVATVVWGLVGGYGFSTPVWSGLGIGLVLAGRTVTKLGEESPQDALYHAVPLPARPRAFLIDATVAITVVAVAIALYRTYVEPEILRLPGMVLYYPFLVVYIVSGGELEGPAGPSTIQIGSYVVVLGLVLGVLAHRLRPVVAAWDRPLWQVLAVAVFVAGGFLGLLFVALPEAGLLGPAPAIVAAALFGLGLLAVGVALAVREWRATSDF